LTYQTPQKATRLHNPKAKPQVEWSYLSTKILSSKPTSSNRKKQTNPITKRQFLAIKDHNKTSEHQKVDLKLLKFRQLRTKNTIKSLTMIDHSFTQVMRTRSTILLTTSFSSRSGMMKSHLS
jgi:hypothetical protein